MKNMIANRNGTILIFALWTLGLLSILALAIGVTARQKLTLISRIESRSQLKYVAEAGVRKAIAVILEDTPVRDLNAQKFSAANKVVRHNNSSQFRNIKIGRGDYEVSYAEYSNLFKRYIKRYGSVDEESKLNLNLASLDELRRLIQEVLAYDENKADKLAASIIDWREYGSSRIVGFYSDDYYESLKDSYEPKKNDFEVMDELLLVAGVDEDAYLKLKNYVTIFGEGITNINTVTEPVLLAFGFSEDFVNKFIKFRRGGDGKENTMDDFVFTNTHDLGILLNSVIEEFSQTDSYVIDGLNHDGRLSIVSKYFAIRSTGKLANSEATKTIDCIYSVPDRLIVHWREI